MEEMTPCSPQQQEVFRRVWARVMGDGDCPVQPGPPEGLEGDLPCRHLAALAVRQPGQEDPPLQLCGQIRQALERRQCYRSLSHRTGGRARQALSRLAEEQHAQARQLAAAHFLRTGVRYWPVRALAAPALPSVWGAVRRCYQLEQNAGQSFESLASRAGDPALAELYGRLAAQCSAHCRTLGELLSQLSP